MSRRLLVLALFAVVALASEESLEDSTSDNSSGSSSSSASSISSTSSTSNTSNTNSTEESPLCPENEEWTICGRLCEPTCRNRNPVYCPAIECSIYTAGCRCLPGWVRVNQDECIVPDECPRNYIRN